MQPVTYHRGKLILGAFGSIMFALVTLWPIVQPGVRLPGTFGAGMASTFGHFVLTPLLVLGAAILAWRLALIAAGSLDAVVVDDAGVTVTSMWKTQQIPWPDLILARLIERRTRYNRRRYDFCFDRRSGSSVRLPLALTALPVDAYRDYLIALGDEQYRRAHRPPSVARGALPTPATDAPAPRGFGRRGIAG